MSRCPICGTENAPGLTVCDFCGGSLPQEKTTTNTKEHKYYVGLDRVGEDRVAVIRTVQELCNCSFDNACEKIDGDGIILAEVNKLQAEIAVTKLRAAGASATMEDLDYNEGDDFANNQNTTASAPQKPVANTSFFDNSNYGILAIVCTLFFGWVGLVMAILGMVKSTNKGVRKSCKIAIIISIVCVALYIVLLVVYIGFYGALIGSSYYY